MTAEDLHVFLATYNRPEQMARQLDSLLNQTVRPSIITVLDNGENPDTRRYVEERAGQGARYVNTHALGVRGNGYMIKRLGGTSGYIALFHDDDFVASSYFDYVLRTINAHPGIALVVGEAAVQKYGAFLMPTEIPHGNGLLLNGRDWALLMYSCGTRKYPFAFYRADIYANLDVFAIFDTFGGAGDIAMLLRAVGEDGVAAFLLYPFCIYGIHPGQHSCNAAILPPASCLVRLNAEFHRFMGDDLTTLAGFTYVFNCRRKLRSAYKRRCRHDLTYREFMRYARQEGALLRKELLFRGASTHLTQKLLDRFVADRLFAKVIDLAGA